MPKDNDFDVEVREVSKEDAQALEFPPQERDDERVKKEHRKQLEDEKVKGHPSDKEKDND